MSADVVRRVIVGVPARNEERRIERCIRSILAATDHLPETITTTVTVASDDSTDGTDHMLHHMAVEFPTLHVVCGRWHSAGAARRSAIEHALNDTTSGYCGLTETWIATTDADTSVPTDWLAKQIRRAELGCDALAGIVDIAGDPESTPHMVKVFRSFYSLGARTHSHVHGANMGIRANAYVAVGGFPPVALSEDHTLWNELGRRNYRRLSPIDLRVHTSSRADPRAVGGFGDTLAGAMA